MIKILFICHGNICRSPMAVFIMKDMVEKAGLSGNFHMESAATSSEELGNPVYPPARKELLRHGIDPTGKRARRIRKEDYESYDLLIGMDNWNLKNMQRAFSGDPGHKLHLLLDFTDEPGEIDDPWYTRDFGLCYRQIEEGCRSLLKSCLSHL